MAAIVVIDGRGIWEPQKRVTNDGLATCRMVVLSTRKRKGEEETTAFQVTFFGRSADTFAEYTGKGDRVLITGTVERITRDDQYGDKIEVLANSWELLQRTKANQERSRQPQSPPEDETGEFGPPLDMDGPLSPGD